MQVTKIYADVASPYLTTVHSKQYDFNRWIYAVMMNGKEEFVIPQGAVACFKMRKPDGNGVIYDSDDTGPAVFIDGNTVKIKIVDQCLTTYGDAVCEIGIITSGDRITTFCFKMQIEAAAIQDETIVSSGYINLLTQKLQEAVAALNNLPAGGSVNQVLTKTASGATWKNASQDLEGTLLANNWSGSSAPYSQAVTVTGVLASDHPIVDAVMTGIYADDVELEEDWAKIYRISVTANTLTFYSKALMSNDVDFIARCIR